MTPSIQSQPHQRSQSMTGTKELAKPLHNKTQSSRQQASKIKDQGHKREISMITLRGRLLELEVLIIYVIKGRSQ